MSETELPTGRDSLEQEVGGRQPLPEWNPTPDEPKEYARGDAGIVDAANDLSRDRGSTEAPLVELTDKRKPKPGQREFYDTVENAAHDLSEYHKTENAIATAENLNALAPAVDEFRATWTGTNTEAPNFQPPLPGAQPQPDAQQTAQAEALQPQPDGPQPEIGEQPPSGLSPKIAAALADPEIRQAIEAPIAQAVQVQQAYTQATAQVAEAALASVLASFPELGRYNAQQLPMALDIIGQQNPQRRAEIDAHLNRVNAVYQAAQQAKAVEAHQNQQRYQAWSKTEDDRLLAKIPELAADTDMKISKAAIKSLNDVGYTNDELAAAWHGQPFSMRDHRAQLLIWKAAQYDMAKAGIGRPEPKSLPSVQRPGIAPSAGERSNVDLSELRNEFRKATGNEQLRLAAKLQQAQRRSRG